MTDGAVASLARAAGLRVDWVDAEGKPRHASLETLRTVLAALGYPAATTREIAESKSRIVAERSAVPPLIVVKRGATFRIRNQSRSIRLRLEDGRDHSLRVHSSAASSITLRAPDICGYHRLESGDRAHMIAVVPERCFTVDDIRPAARFSGLSVQIFSLRGGTTREFGDFAALAEIAAAAADFGIDAVMLSPVHASFGSRLSQYSPYAPSSRLFLNPLYAAAGPGRDHVRDNSRFIDWSEASRGKYAELRSLFEACNGRSDDFEVFCKSRSSRLLQHALFEALDRHFRARGIDSWRKWPLPYRTPAAASMRRLVREHRNEVTFQLFLQWLAARSLEAAQRAARERMSIGLIADIAVGMDPEGSHAWSAPIELLAGLRIGAPPDAFNPKGQDWGLTTFSPRGLRATGYAGFIETLRANMRYAGGIRMDHVMGLQRLWVLPEGAGPNEGVYLHYPQPDLFGLIALESQRHRVIVIGEDLGTVPPGFRRTLARAGIMGMQVLWFERGRGGIFVEPRRWRRDAVAVTTTHDLSTLAGWWTARDIDWRTRLGWISESAVRRERRTRAADRKKLLSAFAAAGCMKRQRPTRTDPVRIVDAALTFVGKTNCSLAIAPLEDLMADIEQPNLPGTIDEHPNWRRRIRLRAPLRNADVQKRIRHFTAARSTS